VTGFRIGQLLLALGVALVATVTLLLLPRLPEPVIVRAGEVGPFVTDGETAQLRNFFGFNEPERDGERTFRWTTGEGSFVVRNGQRLGEPLLLRLRLCGCRLDDQPAPRLQIRANGVTLADTVATARWGEWRDYTLLIPQQPAGYSPDLFIEILSDYVPNSVYSSPLGVAFEYAILEPALPQRAYTPVEAVLLGVGVWGLWAGRPGGRGQGAGGRGQGAGVVLCRWSVVVRRSSFVLRRSSSVLRRPSPVVRRSHSVLRRSSFVLRPPSFVVRRSSSVVRPPSFVLRRSSIVAFLALGLVVAQGVLYRVQPLSASLLALALLIALGLAPALGRSTVEKVGLVALFAVPTLAIQTLGGWMLDDAFISFRYAQNALFGHGFVFNPGERVEGYTNFLWTASFVPLLGAGFNPSVASQFITLLLSMMILALTWIGARSLAGPLAAFITLVLLATSTPFVLYAARGSGMETALFTLLVLAGAITYGKLGVRGQGSGVRRHGDTEFQGHLAILSPRHLVIVSGVVFGLAAMTRPEGVLVAGVTGLHLLWSSWRAGGIAWRRILLFAAGFLAIFGPYYLWRFTYYGYPLPNTFYAKVGGTGAQAVRGLEYAVQFLISQAPLVLIAIFSFLLYDKETGRPGDKETKGKDALVHPLLPYSPTPLPPFTGYLCLLVGVYTAYIIAVGGDHFPYYRFFVPLLPLLALLGSGVRGQGSGVRGQGSSSVGGQSSFVVRRSSSVVRRSSFVVRRSSSVLRPPSSVLRRSLFGLIVIIGIVWQAPQLYESRTLNANGQVYGEHSVVEKNREIGLWLKQNTPPDALVSTGIAGALPYYSERPVLDSLGLNDLYIAHLDVPTMGQGIAGAEKTDVAYVLSRRPAYIPYNSIGPFRGNATFTANYELMILRGPEGRGMRLYRRVDLPMPSRAREPEQTLNNLSDVKPGQ
jgi:hypothetical protein